MHQVTINPSASFRYIYIMKLEIVNKLHDQECKLMALRYIVTKVYHLEEH